MRWIWSRVHRYSGLVMAAFVIFEGLTGSLLALKAPLDRLFRPELHVAAPEGAKALALAELAQRAAALKPSLTVDYVMLRADQALVRMHHGAGDDADDAGTFAGHGHFLYLDPWTGRELPPREAGPSASFASFIDVVYRLHSDLALGTGAPGRSALSRFCGPSIVLSRRISRSRAEAIVSGAGGDAVGSSDRQRPGSDRSTIFIVRAASGPGLCCSSLPGRA